MDERVEAIELANRLLDQPYADPDDDLRVLSRQLLRRHEEIKRLCEDLDRQSDMIQGQDGEIHALRTELLHYVVIAEEEWGADPRDRSPKLKALLGNSNTWAAYDAEVTRSAVSASEHP